MILDMFFVLLSNAKTIYFLPMNVKKFYIHLRHKKYLFEAYKIVENFGLTSNQNSPPGFPVAINSKETWKLVNSMAWLLFNNEVGNPPAQQVYNNLKNNPRYTKQDYINDWHEPLLQSFEYDFDTIKVWEYKEIENYHTPGSTKKKKIYYWFVKQIKNCKNTNWRWCLTSVLLIMIVSKLFL